MRTRRTDWWLIGLVVLLLGVVLGVGYIGLTAIWRQQKATCYQLRSVEQTEHRERELARIGNPVERAAHLKSAENLKLYASGLRAIVPGCPKPQPVTTVTG